MNKMRFDFDTTCPECGTQMDQVDIVTRRANNDGGFITDEEVIEEWECPECHYITGEN